MYAPEVFGRSEEQLQVLRRSVAPVEAAGVGPMREDELSSRRGSPIPGPLGRALVVVSGALVLGCLAFVAWPLPTGLLDPAGALSVQVFDREGQLLREIPSPRDSRSVALPADAPVPAVLRDAFIASEDRRWWHPGWTPAVARAAVSNLRAGGR
jgi:membrane peptidoglycan carboxypeptidase